MAKGLGDFIVALNVHVEKTIDREKSDLEKA